MAGQEHPHTGEVAGGREDSPGWTEEQKQAVKRLRMECTDLPIRIATHSFWDSLNGEDLVKARQTLKSETKPAMSPAVEVTKAAEKHPISPRPPLADALRAPPTRQQDFGSSTERAAGDDRRARLLSPGGFPDGGALPLPMAAGFVVTGTICVALTRHGSPPADRPPRRRRAPAHCGRGARRAAASRTAGTRRRRGCRVAPTGGSPGRSGALRPRPGPEGRLQPMDPGFVISRGIGQDPRPFEVHVGDRRMAKRAKAVSTIEARRLLTENVEACQFRRPDSELGMLD
ncbi:hypothetical protein J7E88_29980 [Streptomyces sp. ISL-10]|uniref:DUF6233 domain-containing protein n=1 Tax=Streptomyces sp. ISL-10 TaxID=2819172 RepID=UPI001BEBE095|nr:DUF6233 domain-containing protein [Streptomyces sp. ISL-10]MBT2369402.1 hypothetical protein [Streptomyces sp. ISL-10]